MSLVPNVIVFGETGSGKSSIVNMVAGHYCTDASNRATGCTFDAECHTVNILGSPFNMYDTAGLDEGESAKVPTQTAIINLYRLIKNLDTGVNLLIFCMRAPRIKDSASKNWKLFHEIICQKKVPIIIAITGLEEEQVMDQWWYNNEAAFRAHDILPSGVACITGTKGKQKKSGEYSLQEEYDESQAKLRHLITKTTLASPWRVQKAEWFSHIVNVTWETRWCRSPKAHREVKTVVAPGIQEMVDRRLMTMEEAKALNEKLVNV